jgi:hypothetical protein
LGKNGRRAPPPPSPPDKVLILKGFIIDYRQFDNGEHLCLWEFCRQMLPSDSKIKNKIYGTLGPSDLASKNFLLFILLFTVVLSQFLCEDHFCLKNLCPQNFLNASKIENKTKNLIYVP